ncbi:hypothetical protein BLNAU_8696 [Blattamonas nauphoetae]|uniref:Uncharacterized protein n=1 Tax=Blattamonas nauphoetae TaxID=2049346 RepID=A0ABQ9XXZ2_9EUKA|nr:hypothetical protein BLNAU_8696 [Blattamonas nauphoetae]
MSIITTHPSHCPLPLHHHPHPPTPLCLSSPPTPSHSHLPLLTTHALPLPSASPSPPAPAHSPLPLPLNPHPLTPLCLSPHSPRCGTCWWLIIPLQTRQDRKGGGVGTKPRRVEWKEERGSEEQTRHRGRIESATVGRAEISDGHEGTKRRESGRKDCKFRFAFRRSRQQFNNHTRARDKIAGSSLQKNKQSEHSYVHTDRQNTDTTDHAASHVVSEVTEILTRYTTAGDSGVHVESTEGQEVTTGANDERSVESEGDGCVDERVLKGAMEENKCVVLEVKGSEAQQCGRGEDRMGLGLPFTVDCSPFLNWTKDKTDSESEKAVIFLSLVATVKSQPVFDVSLEAKAVKFLECVVPKTPYSPDAFLNSIASFSDKSQRGLVESMIILISSPNQAITTASMKMMRSLITRCSDKRRLDLVKAGLIPQLITTLNPLSLSFAEAVDIHTGLMSSITWFLWITTPFGLDYLDIVDGFQTQNVHKMVLKQVLVPSEEYICHLCTNRFSIIDGEQSEHFLLLLAYLLHICPNYQPTIDFVLHMPVFLTIPSCLTFFKNDRSIWICLHSMNNIQQNWNETRGAARQEWKTVHRMLRMEGFEDLVEEKLLNDPKELRGRWIIGSSVDWNNQLGMNLPEQS